MNFLDKHKIIFILSLVFLVLLLGVVSVYSFQFDLTSGKIYSVTDYSKRFLSGLPDYLTVSFFYSDKLSKSFPYKDSILRILNEFQKLSDGKITVLNINPDTPDGKRKAENYGLIPHQIMSVQSSSEIYEVVYSGIVLEYRGQVLTIPIILTPENLEYEFISKVTRLVEPKDYRVVFFNCTGWEDSLFNYAYEVLYNEGIDILFNPVNYEETVNCQVLVVFGDTNVSTEQEEIINRWVMDGKKSLFAISPAGIDITGNWVSRPKEESRFQILFNLFGLSLKNNFVLDYSNVRLALLNKDGTGYDMFNYPFWPRVIPSGNSVILNGLSSIDFFWPGYIETEPNYDLKITPLAETGKLSWLDEITAGTDPYQDFQADQETMGEHLIAVSSENKNSELILVADELFVSNLIESSNGVFNLYFFSQAVQHLLGLDDILSLKKNYLIYNPLIFSGQSEDNSKTIMNIYLCLFLLIPLLIVFIFILVRFYIKKYGK